MASSRPILTLFLASPSDLADERRAAREVVDEVGLTARELNISLELLGWEDTLPGAQRPQAAINPEVDAADVFVGLLWRRWGQPTGNSEFSSGFDEEFSRACSRHAETGRPEIWLFFKDVEPGQLLDPGEQLRRVLDFKAKCHSERRVFSKDFPTTEAWAPLFRTTLSRYVARLAGNAANEPIGEGFGAQAPKRHEPSVPGAPTATASSLLPLAAVLTDLATGNEPSDIADQNHALNSARLYLVGQALLAISRSSSGLAGTHEINTLYRLRNEFDLLPFECALLRRTVLSDHDTAHPGWFWFPKEPEEQLNTLAFYAFFDTDLEVRKGALQLLTKAGIRREGWGGIVFHPDFLRGASSAIQSAVWDYADTVVTSADQEGLQALLPQTNAPDRVAQLLRIARAASEPAQVLAEVANMPTEPSHRLMQVLSPRMHDIDSTVLIAAFSSRHATVRLPIAEELARRQQFQEIHAAATKDAHPAVQLLAYRESLRAAVEAGEPRPSLPSGVSALAALDLEVERLRGLSREELEAKVDWLKADSPAAYEVLATDYWGAVGTQVRKDLTTRFERIRLESLDLLTRTIAEQTSAPADNVRALIEQKLDTSSDDFVRWRYARAALAGIERHGEPEDAAYARNALANFLTTEVACRILARLGTEEDVGALVRIAMDSYGVPRAVAAEAALSLSQNSWDIVDVFVRSGDPVLIRLALPAAGPLDESVFVARLLPLLNDEHPATRLSVVRAMASRLERDTLIAILNDYMAQPQYYYNVAVALDRSLYAAPEIAAVLDDDLE